MHKSIRRFFDLFKKSFVPPCPSRGKNGKNWLIFKAWGDYLRDDWLRIQFGYINPGRGRQAGLHERDTADQTAEFDFDYGLRWQFDNNAAYDDFVDIDFPMLLDVNAAYFIAMVHTRAHTPSWLAKAHDLVNRIHKANKERREGDKRPVGLIEIRRTHHSTTAVKFSFFGYDLGRTAALTPIKLGDVDFHD